jgi:ATPase family AAA domain-containing protein 3A/B
MARQGLVIGSAAAAVWLGSSTSLVALADDKKEKKEKDATAPYFDPEALERGAKALREINASPHAKQASQQAVNSWSVVAWLYACGQAGR